MNDMALLEIYKMLQEQYKRLALELENLDRVLLAFEKILPDAEIDDEF
ncbi:MAG TPA: hypothetical protein VNQ76_21735 [Planctomicrobium sp.]|nr:hypothetical protein [Planctomicrobium sp.]